MIELTQPQDLKLYLFAGGIPAPDVKSFHGNLAFTLEEAQQKLIESMQGKPALMFTFCGTYPIKSIMEKIEDRPHQIKTREAFLNGLKLAAEEFVKDPKEKTKLKKILTNLEKIV